MGQLDRNQILGIVLGISATVIWAGWPVLSKIATNSQLAPYDITMLRFSISGLVLLPLFIVRFAKLKAIAGKGVILAFGAGAPYVLVGTSGMAYAPTSHFSIIMPTSMLLFTTIASVLWLGEKLTLARILGISFIIAGVVFVGGNSLGSLALEDTLIGDFMFLMCGFLWSIYTVLARYWKINPWDATVLVSMVSIVLYMPFYLYQFGGQILAVDTDTLIVQGLYQGVFASIGALYLYSKAISLLGASKGAIFSVLLPPLSLLLGSFLLEEVLTWVEVGGLILVCLGMLFAFEVFRMPKRLIKASSFSSKQDS
ncbi:MAG: DMT family transporter [Marinomonas sp.]